jgi:aminopeptidase N
MIRFFEEKSGIPYIQDSYSQILMGNSYQEMSGFSMLKSSYGELVLKDSTEMNLISHELAHQWWGNMITCGNWNNFWLNEGLATFMSAAYNESRFGGEKYQADINAYRNVYEKIKNRGTDKSLVFEDWLHPSSDDRNLVYFKGAYALHMLRMHLGDELFWNGIKYYSKMYFGKSVTTRQFQKAMEESTNQSLEEFFNAWIYLE